MLLCHREGSTDRLLLARRAHWVHGGNGEWSVPGGAIDEHEDPIEAALREFDEEIGAVPSGWRLAGIHEVVVQQGLWSYHTCCALVDDRPHYDATLSPENDEAAWWAIDELDDLPLFQVAVRREEIQKSGPSKVEEALRSLDLDDLTPRQALEALYDLKKQLGKP